MMLINEIPFKSDDPSIAGIILFEDKQIQGDIKRMPPMRTNHPWTCTPLDLKHARDVRYQASPLFSCFEKIGSLGMRLRLSHTRASAAAQEQNQGFS